MTLTIPQERSWLCSTAPAFGSTAELLIDGEASLTGRAHERLRSLELSWSTSLPGGELDELLRERGTWQHVSADLAAALRWSQRLHHETGGLFDPSMPRCGHDGAADRSFEEVVGIAGDRGDRTPPFAIGDIEFDGRTRVRIPPGLSINLSGLGPALAADMLAYELYEAGANSVYVSVGGAVHALGEPPDGTAWHVRILHPETGAQIAVHTLELGALVVTTTLRRRCNRGMAALHDVVDPRRGELARSDVLAVAVASRSAARAEALAQSAVMLGADEGVARLRQAEVAAYVMTVDGVLVVDEPSPWS